MLLSQVFPSERICLALESTDKYESFEELTEILVRHTPGTIDRDVVLAALNERERKMSTGIKRGIALPHAQIDGLRGTYGCMGISRAGFDYEALDQDPVYLVFLIISPLDDPESHLRVLDHLAVVLESPDFFQAVLDEKDAPGIQRVMARFEQVLIGSIHP